MNKFCKLILPIFLGVLLFTACDPTGDERPLGVYDAGVLILNEGAFGANEGGYFILIPPLLYLALTFLKK